ncbi:MAG: transcription termination/antitermination factor NusG [Clostridia bacterium]|nr:transcription termination/antitermination factor NusG [Clostridia bacterium]
MAKPEEAKWYVIHTYSGYESLVKDNIEKLIENNNLGDTIVDIKIPMEETIEEKNGKKKVVTRRLLPCYVFIKMVYSNDMWFLLTNTRGVTGFVGPQGKAIPLGEDEVKKMRLEVVKIESLDMSIGDTVNITDGPLNEAVGTIMDLNDSTQKAKVKVSMWGTETEVELDYGQFEKVNVENA